MNAAKSIAQLSTPNSRPLPLPSIHALDSTPRLCQVEIDSGKHGGRAVHCGTVQPVNVGGVGFLLIRSIAGVTELLVNAHHVVSIQPMTRSALTLPNPREIIEQIQQLVARYYGLSVEQLLAQDRHEFVATARMVAMYFCRQTGITFESIGRHFGGRDHGTVIHACKIIPARVANEFPLRAAVMEMKELGAGLFHRLDVDQLQLPLFCGRTISSWKPPPQRPDCRRDAMAAFHAAHCYPAIV